MNNSIDNSICKNNEKTFRQNIGSNIKKFRQAASLTQQQLADALDKTESTIRKYENGSIEAPLSTLYKICNILNIEIWDLIGVDRETAHKNGDMVAEWGLFYTDEDERKEHEAQGLLYALEKKDIFLYWEKFLNPFLKTLGYKGHHVLGINGEYTLILQENGIDKWQISLEDAKDSIAESLDLASYRLKRSCSEITVETQKALQDLKDSSPVILTFDEKLKQLDKQIDERTNITDRKISALKNAPNKKIVTSVNSIDELP